MPLTNMPFVAAADEYGVNTAQGLRS